MRAGLKQTPAWKLLRALKRAAFAPRVDGVLPAAQCRSRTAIVQAPVALEAGQRFEARVRLENLAGVAWTHAGAKPVKLHCEWRTLAGARFGDVQEVALLRPLFPGEAQERALALRAPEFVGDFTLHIDFAQDDAFAERNADSVAATAGIPVQGRRTTDIDYHAVYRTANLAENHWWVVGAYHSREQYEASSRERLAMLAKHGLTPDSHVLDVGCGTGQMAKVLMPYLSERGAYAGTDIGKEAIDFCRANFRKPNFRFRQGGMTAIPFDENSSFDLAIYFSVFTHTFPDETALLLGETARLLKPGGSAIVDAITSPLVERGAGHRGEMVLNRDHFFRLAAMVGFSGEVIGRWDWNAHAERIMVRFRKT